MSDVLDRAEDAMVDPQLAWWMRGLLRDLVSELERLRWEK